jgi:hypothetical protein
MSNDISLFSNHFHFIQNAFLINLIDFHCHNGKVNWQIMNYIWQKRNLFYKSSLTSKINGKINWKIVKHHWQKEKSKRKTLYLTSSCVNWRFFGTRRVEYNVFLFDEPLKGSKSLKIFKISLTFRFDRLSNLSKSVHTGENFQILTVSNKKKLWLQTNGEFFFDQVSKILRKIG